jgi:hypothetical protein
MHSNYDHRSGIALDEAFQLHVVQPQLLLDLVLLLVGVGFDHFKCFSLEYLELHRFLLVLGVDQAG